MAKINSETKFVRSAECENAKGQKVTFMFQPYITGMYMAINENGRCVCQNTVAYSKLAKLVKNFESDLKSNSELKNIEVNYSTIGKYLSEGDLKILNG